MDFKFQPTKISLIFKNVHFIMLIGFACAFTKKIHSKMTNIWFMGIHFGKLLCMTIFYRKYTCIMCIIHRLL